MTQPLSNVRPPVSVSRRSLRDTSEGAMFWVLAVIFLLLLVANTIFNKPVLALALLIYLPFFMATFLTSLEQAARLWTRPVGMPLLWFIFVASYFWSVVPKASLERIVTLSAFMILVMFVTVRQRDEGFYKSLRVAAQWLIVLVCLYCVVRLRGAFIGGSLVAFYPQKNNLGSMMAICLLVLYFAPERKWWHVGFGLLAAALLLLTRSKTSIGLIVICGLLLPLVDAYVKRQKARTALPKSKLRPALNTIVYPTLVTLLVFLVIFRDRFLDLIWNSMTKDMLTGRGTLWLTVIQHIRGNSLLGIGPGTFWDAAGASEIAHTILYLMDPLWIQTMVSADGSYIDLIASIGVLGLALFLLTAVDLYRLLLRNWFKQDSRLMFVLVTFVLIHAITETTILASSNLLWFVYLLCYFRTVMYERLRTGTWFESAAKA